MQSLGVETKWYFTFIIITRSVKAIYVLENKACTWQFIRSDVLLSRLSLSSSPVEVAAWKTLKSSVNISFSYIHLDDHKRKTILLERYV